MEKYEKLAQKTVSDKFYGDKVNLSVFITMLKDFIELSNKIDFVKKQLFYGRDLPKECKLIVPVNYVLGHNKLEDAKFKIDLIHGVLGLITESGELTEALLNHLNGLRLDRTNVIEEIGDLQWYEALIVNTIGSSFDEVQRKNIEKLMKNRYPDGFSEERANNRDLDTEREFLERPPSEEEND